MFSKNIFHLHAARDSERDHTLIFPMATLNSEANQKGRCSKDLCESKGEIMWDNR